jgi:large subunit ribosomal protein L3
MKSLGLMGHKLGMSRIFGDDGSSVPVTVIEAKPCPVIQIKDEKTDGYCALQVGFDELSAHKVNKPMKGHQEKAQSGYYRKLKEFRVQDAQEYEPGQKLTVEMFTVGERVKVNASTKGRGFAGVVKRWNFGGSPSTHGHHKVHRTTGAIGHCADPARVFKGKKMPGHMGTNQVTLKNAEIIDIRPEDNIILVRGQVPGPKYGTVIVRKNS